MAAVKFGLFNGAMMANLPTAEDIASSTAGAVARRQGLPRSTNPHPAGTSNNRFWDQGWGNQPKHERIAAEVSASLDSLYDADPIPRAYGVGEIDASCNLPSEPSPAFSAEERAAYMQGYARTAAELYDWEDGKPN
jgi:hypothetical protein